MPDFRIDHSTPITGTPSVSADQRRREGERQPQHQQSGGGKSRPGAEELAVAMDGRQQLAARFEQEADGQPLVRIFDRESGETVALLTPEELRVLAEQTGLPPGMLVHVSS